MKWKNVFLQGLVGRGLVGYNTVKTLIDGLEAQPIKDYAEYFPSLALIDNGVVENQCVRIFEKSMKEEKYNFLIMNGPQPRSDELSSFFLKQIIKDIYEYKDKIDVYLSFGAYVNKNLAPYEIQTEEKLSVDKLADLVLENEMNKHLTLNSEP